MTTKPKVLLAMDRKLVEQIFNKEDFEFLTSFSDTTRIDSIPDTVDASFIKRNIQDKDVCISCWGTPPFTKDILDEANKLRLIAHSAGSVKPILTDHVWKNNVKVTSATPGIATAVAEITLGLMIVSLKRVVQFNALIHKGDWRVEEEISKAKSLYNVTIGVVGASYVGRNVIKLLKAFTVDILLYDPYVSQDEAQALGVSLTSLEELLSKSDVVSLHAPIIPETYHMLNRHNIKLLQPGAILINTAIGPLIDENALIERLKKGDVFAYLDRTDPEPPSPDNPLRTLPNVILTPHIAGGSAINDKWRQGNYISHQIHKFVTQNRLDYEITREMLSRIA